MVHGVVKRTKGFSWTALICTVAAVLCTGAALLSVASGDNITSDDPLISLSYLNGIFKTEIMGEVNDLVTQEMDSVERKFSDRISGIKNALEVSPSPAGTHRSLTLYGNDTGVIPANSEFLFVSGSAWAKEAGLLDVTTGTSVDPGTKLLENHLYAVIGEVTLFAESQSTLILSQ